jgi:hypothetical protein
MVSFGIFSPFWSVVPRRIWQTLTPATSVQRAKENFPVKIFNRFEIRPDFVFVHFEKRIFPFRAETESY